MPDNILDVHVFGTPAPQGSKKHVGRGVMVEQSSKRIKPWREAVKYAALEVLHDRQRPSPPPPVDGPVDVHIGFLLPRPKGHYRTGRHSHLLRDAAPTRPGSRPDLDKLARSTLDALKDAGVYHDDGQIVTLTLHKWYADGQSCGARITIRRLT